MPEQMNFSKEKLEGVLQNAYAPFSNFKVGACVESESGHHYYGCNVENSTYGATICAERTAIVKMISAEGPEAKIKKVYVMALTDEPVSPCGICRQNIFEFTTKDISILSYSKDFKKEKTFQIKELLPEGFKL